MILELALAELLGTSQAERGVKVREALASGMRVLMVTAPLGAGSDSSRPVVILYSPLGQGQTSIELSPDELAVVADYACETGHPDAQKLAHAAARATQR